MLDSSIGTEYVHAISMCIWYDYLAIVSDSNIGWVIQVSHVAEKFTISAYFTEIVISLVR